MNVIHISARNFFGDASVSLLEARTHPEQVFCAMKVDVHLPSGDGYSVDVSPETSVSELKAAAQQHFRRRLQAGLRDGEGVAAVVQLGKLAASDAAFAWHGHGGEVVTWGNPEWG